MGGAPLAEVIPVRIATSVILLATSAFVEAIDYLIAPNANGALRADVVSMSMGGVASKAWAEVVNRAYEAGICLVTAAGNNKLGSPQSIVYPARFRRVIAACGIMANRRPYIRANVGFGQMAGNFGPDSKMDTALAAFTPNTPWAEINCPGIIDMDGGGTSSATPQIAAAAALWLQKHKGNLSYNEPWMVVEAVRRALFASADKSLPNSRTFLGQGVLQAARALEERPAAAQELVKTPEDAASFPILHILTGQGVAAPAPRDMLEVEALQLLQRDEEIEQTISDPDLPAAELPVQEVKRFLEATIASEHASATLRTYLKRVYTSRFAGPDLRALPDKSLPYGKTEGEVLLMRPTCRRLRGYAFDPDLATRLEATDISQIVFDVRWEDDLRPGPVGEYLEVIDYDPASGGYYAPIDLDNPNILATDGLPPTESNPKFHQQFVYAVAMKTIETFESALGRKALWSPRMHGRKDYDYVAQLRIYPHALREANAYYHPEKKALLFGYFPAAARDPGRLYPQGMVFTCLAHDIVAHETTHALLDGMHRAFQRPSNEDQLAFHEAFADIVALFQHFSKPAVLNHQIAKTRGDLRARNMLGELATQFGEATGLRGALRSYIGETDSKTGQWRALQPDPTAYQTVTEPHYRGALLVAAVFDAFLGIYERRSADLIRIATSGTGVLPSGAIHPDLVGRLSEEAAKAAQHVLSMCIRALDYCPPLDLTFGDYLRALITADLDLVPYDPLCYRVAFVDAFRRQGIYPMDLATLSVDTLCWKPAESEGREVSNFFAPVLRKLRTFATESEYLNSGRRSRTRKGDEREAIFRHAWRWRAIIHDQIKREIKKIKDKAVRARVTIPLGLDFSAGDEKFEVHSLRLARKRGPYNTTQGQIVMSLVQEKKVSSGKAGDGALFAFGGGCTIIADLEQSKINYIICKNILSQARRDRQIAFYSRPATSLFATYFDDTGLNGLGQRFAMLHADEGDEING
ncbi:MAG: S8 family serine peptidase [Rhodospirillales bacterium]|nr:S8 family serine peptidase [Rhodospirillales bacterium]